MTNSEKIELRHAFEAFCLQEELSTKLSGFGRYKDPGVQSIWLIWLAVKEPVNRNAGNQEED